jgi:hypothetical protein
MKTLLRIVLSLAVTTAAFAVYAPIPEQEQGKALSFRLGASIYHDSNIFGSANGAIGSMIYNVSPAILFNSSVTDQTFLSASYELSLDHFADRPGSKDLASHNLQGRVAHSFSASTNLDLTENYQISHNPQSLLNGVPLNVDQSLDRNEFDARFSTNAGEKVGVILKYRNEIFDYTDPTLGDSLNRMEQLAGLELSDAFLPETKIVAEFRYQDIAYDHGGSTKDKQSNFFMAGVDYSPGEKTTLSSRVGFENRTRSGESSTTVPHAELSARYAYAEASFLAAGYTYSIQEPSDTTRFTDSKVNSFFVNLQQQLSPLITASGSLTYEPAQLLGRPTFASINEKTTRFGLALSWLPTKNLTVSATYDLDHIDSDDPSRSQERTRVGVSARLMF